MHCVWKMLELLNSEADRSFTNKWKLDLTLHFLERKAFQALLCNSTTNLDLSYQSQPHIIPPLIDPSEPTVSLANHYQQHSRNKIKHMTNRLDEQTTGKTTTTIMIIIVIDNKCQWSWKGLVLPVKRRLADHFERSGSYLSPFTRWGSCRLRRGFGCRLRRPTGRCRDLQSSRTNPASFPDSFPFSQFP